MKKLNSKEYLIITEYMLIFFGIIIILVLISTIQI